MSKEKESEIKKEDANTIINPPDNWSDVELKEDAKDREKGPAQTP